MGSLANTENTQRINGLVEDLHEAFMDYQVGIPKYSFYTHLTFVLDFITKRYL